MPAPIPRFEVRNYGPLRDVKLELTPLHALIGPNDSGKSTLLRALRTAVQIAAGGFNESKGDVKPFDPGLGLNPKCELRLPLGTGTFFWVRPSLSVSVPGEEIFECELVRRDVFNLDKEKVVPYQGFDVMRYSPFRLDRSGFPIPPPDFNGAPAEASAWQALQRGAWLIRFDPDALRAPGLPIPESQAASVFDERGHGLPGVYDRILNRSPRDFLAIVAEAQTLFPTVKNIGFTVNSKHEKELEIELTSGSRVPAAFVSEGLLYYLAFAAIRHLDPPAILLVEEPENGLHPSRVADVMRILREVSKTTQVLIATHSPLVVNELQGNEVSVITRDAKEGTRVTLLSNTPNFAERSKIYSLGELWVSYANGSDEAPLLSGSTK